jgi:Gluconate 2-dehydrogenase subunit 3
MLRMMALGLLSKLSGREAAARDWEPQFFNVAQNEALVALGERIIPGSAEALCNRLIDLVMPIESDKNKRDFLECLAAFDREAQSRHGQSFGKISAAVQDEILTHASAQGAPLHHDFQLVKEWMADAYWSSQKGLAELGSTGRMAWAEFPGCPNAQTHT